MAEQPPCVLRRHRVGLRRLRLTATRPKDRPPCAGRLFGNPLLASACPLPKLDRSTGRGVRVERRWSAMSLVLALLGAARAALRTHTDLALENLALRQQLALLRHRSKRPRFGRLDRAFWVWLFGGGQGGARRSTSFAPKPSFVGIGRAFALSGPGSPDAGERVDRPSAPNLRSSSAPWRSPILSGARRASTANCSSWGSTFRNARLHV